MSVASGTSISDIEVTAFLNRPSTGLLILPLQSKDQTGLIARMPKHITTVEFVGRAMVV